METILQAHPDVKVVCCIGGGGAAGANEAFKGHYGSEVPEDVGIFSTDLTDETVASMENGEFNRMCVAITGNAYVCGETIYDIAVRYAQGEEMDHNVYRDLIPVTTEIWLRWLLSNSTFPGRKEKVQREKGTVVSGSSPR